MKIYTKTGDEGYTGLFAGPRVAKDDPRVEANGDVDELNAVLGVARAAGLCAELDPLVSRLQNELFDLGAQLATPDPAAHGHARIGPQRVAALEAEIDRLEATLDPLAAFILPGGSPAAAQLHLARTVCRRAERRVVTLARSAGAKIDPLVVVYLNRLSDLLFVLARASNKREGNHEEKWEQPPNP